MALRSHCPRSSARSGGTALGAHHPGRSGPSTHPDLCLKPLVPWWKLIRSGTECPKAGCTSILCSTCAPGGRTPCLAWPLTPTTAWGLLMKHDENHPFLSRRSSQTTGVSSPSGSPNASMSEGWFIAIPRSGNRTTTPTWNGSIGPFKMNV